MTSVLQDWVMALPLREQGVLVTALRGCDTEEKFGPTKPFTRYLRNCILNPADAREVGIRGAFFDDHIPDRIKTSALDAFPFHFVMHLLHAAQIVGYRHPNPAVANYWQTTYEKWVHGMHLQPEPFDTMVRRLSEDRILAGTVVS